MVSPICAGDLTTVTPALSSAEILSVAVPLPPAMMAPAWPMRLPGGAVSPALAQHLTVSGYGTGYRIHDGGCEDKLVTGWWGRAAMKACSHDWQTRTNLDRDGIALQGGNFDKEGVQKVLVTSC